MTIRDKFLQLEKEVNGEVFERQQEIRGALLALLSKKHHFQIGPPGTAKSFLVVRITKRIEFPTDNAYFHWLMTMYTTPPELYGGPILPLLREGVYKLNTDRKLPVAYVAFIDEIFKGNSSILNANLMIMNERRFYNADDDPNIPLISMFGASNEMPVGETLNALWDRLHFRFVVDALQETTSFMKMMRAGHLIDPNKIITLDEIIQAQEEVLKVAVPDDIHETLKDLRDNMHNAGLRVTERRWVDCIEIIQAEAYLRGRDKADMDDLKPLMHVLWEQLDQRKAVRRLVFDLANPIDRDADEINERVLALRKEFTDTVKDADSSHSVAKMSMETHAKVKKARNEMNELERKRKQSGRESEVLIELNKNIQDLFKMLVSEGFGLDGSILTPDTI